MTVYRNALSLIFPLSLSLFLQFLPPSWPGFYLKLPEKMRLITHFRQCSAQGQCLSLYTFSTRGSAWKKKTMGHNLRADLQQYKITINERQHTSNRERGSEKVGSKTHMPVVVNHLTTNLYCGFPHLLINAFPYFP